MTRAHTNTNTNTPSKTPVLVFESMFMIHITIHLFPTSHICLYLSFVFICPCGDGNVGHHRCQRANLSQHQPLSSLDAYWGSSHQPLACSPGAGCGLGSWMSWASARLTFFGTCLPCFTCSFVASNMWHDHCMPQNLLVFLLGQGLTVCHRTHCGLLVISPLSSRDTWSSMDWQGPRPQICRGPQP